MNISSSEQVTHMIFVSVAIGAVIGAMATYCWLGTMHIIHEIKIKRRRMALWRSLKVVRPGTLNKDWHIVE